MTSRAEGSASTTRRPLLSKSLSRVHFGQHAVDLEANRQLGCVIVRFYAKNAVGLIHQVQIRSIALHLTRLICHSANKPHNLTIGCLIRSTR